MRCDAVKPYYEKLRGKRKSLLAKRLFDVVVSFLLLVVLSPAFLLLAAIIKTDSPGPVFFRQERVTQYGKRFRIFKFRTMAANAENAGAQVTILHDMRVTKAGKYLRKYRLDETAQLLDILRGTMSFVGTRPEVTKYIGSYSAEMMATLLLPAGVTSEASIRFRDEERLLAGEENIDRAYIEKILPDKMKYNLQSLANFSLSRDIGIMLRTVRVLVKRDRTRRVL